MYKKAIFIFFCALFLGISSIFLTKGVAEDEDIIISSNTSWEAGAYTYRDISITNNATLTLEGDSVAGTGVTINARNITVEAGSSISANEQGYPRMEGPGAGARDGSFNGAGAGYGGIALNQGNASGGGTYGSALEPIDLGSGGGSAEANVGAGGGAIKLNVSGTLDIAGTVSANGDAGNKYDGGGSGGSVWVNTSVLKDSSGSGTVEAKGGNTADWSTGGAGGRVAVYYEDLDGTNPFDLTSISTLGGQNTALQKSEDGTIFIIDSDDRNVLVNNTLRLEPSEGYSEEGVLTDDGLYYFNNLTVSNNSTLTLFGSNTDDEDGVGSTFYLSGNLTVDEGSTIYATGKGYGAGQGPGKGLIELSGGTGAGYGGDGARAFGGGYGNVEAGSAYGSALFPEDLGSGGGQSTGGAGGGLIKIVSDGDVDINGNISSEGGNATRYGGGGSGGSIYIVGGSLAGTGTVSARGGDGGPDGYCGGGGGGRVAFYYTAITFDTNNINVAGGVDPSANSAEDGTIFLYNTGTGDVEVTQDVSFEGNAGVSRDGSKRTDGVYYFNNLTISNSATVTINGYYTTDDDGTGVTINLDGGLTVGAGSSITGLGLGHDSQSGRGKGLQGAGNASGGGGSYGGTGGGGAFDGTFGDSYGDTEKYYPYFLGSGGGNCNGGVGGSGGSALSIRSLGDVVIDGDIDFSGADGVAGTSTYGSGGGSGGSIFLSGTNFTGSGNIQANGGAGGAEGDGGGAGGGGRVSISYFETFEIPEENVVANGGIGSISPDRDGADGTVYIRMMDLPEANFNLKNPNNNSTQYTNTTDVTVDPTDPDVVEYFESSNGSPTPPFYDNGWRQVSEGKDLDGGEGEKTVRAWLKDDNQLISSAVGEATITLDQTNPVLSLNSDSSSTKSATFSISGTASDVLSGINRVTVNGISATESAYNLYSILESEKELIINEDGSFSSSVDLVLGENDIEVTAYDGAGNSATSSLTITRLAPDSVSTPTPTVTATTAPTTTSTATSASSSGSGEDSSSEDQSDTSDQSSALDTEKISSEATDGFSIVDNKLIFHTNSPTLFGKSDPFALVVIKLGNEELNAVADENGEWEYRFSDLSNGNYDIIIEEYDQQGNLIRSSNYILAIMEGEPPVIDTESPIVLDSEKIDEGNNNRTLLIVLILVVLGFLAYFVLRKK